MTFMLFLLSTLFLLHTPTNDAAALLQRVQTRYDLVQDYSADVSIKVNVTFIKVPVKKGRLFFKQPDKIKLESPGFTILPKKGMGYGFYELFSKPYTSIYIRNERINGRNLAQVKVLPVDDQSDLLLATLWIDESSALVNRAELVSKTAGNSKIKISYPERPDRYGMPSRIEFEFDVTQKALPMGITGEFDGPAKVAPDGKQDKARLTVDYSAYKINSGLTDSFFISKKN